MNKNYVATASVVINAPIQKAWDALINPEVIKKYMFGTDVHSDWKEGSAIVWRGEWQGKPYEDKGKILKIEKEHLLQYSHFSPLTGKPDIPGNYHTITIEISLNYSRTSVTLSQDNNETEESREHSEKNWQMTLDSLKRLLSLQTILGANGTIGSVLALELRKYTERVRLVSRYPMKVDEKDELYPADLSDDAQVDKAIEGSEVVYLVVGFDYKLSVWQANWPKLMRAAINACIKHKSKLVFFDNVYMYDINAISHMTEDSMVIPPSKKGMVRKTVSAMLLDEAKSGNLTALIARSADFYGPNNNRSLLNELVYKNIKKGKKPNWPIDPNKKHSFTFTPDAAKATALLGNTDDAFNQVWHLPTDKNALTGNEMIKLFAKEMKAEPKVSVVSLWLFKILGLFNPIMKEMVEMMYQFDRDYFFDSTKFDRRFNFRTTTYKEGVKRTIEQSK
jgi:nucleoside-diphosphate-sugar epimerase/uncharacterized protein YndB with AHSA1/START domain